MDSTFDNGEEGKDNFQFDDIDVEELEKVLNHGLLTKGTKRQYDVQLKKFSTFLNLPWNPEVDILKAAFTDKRIASFLMDIAKKSEFKPHIKKSALAAISFMVKKHGLPSLANNHLIWPLTEKAIQVHIYKSLFNIN